MTLRDTAFTEKLKNQLRKLIDLINDAHDTHIYSEDDEHPKDCIYCAAVKEAEELIYKGR
jgi:hypothetical protein